MMAAGRAAERGARVVVLEKNRACGEKLRRTGGGRCNITNAEDDVRVLLAHFGDAKDHLFSPFSQFGVRDTFSFFEDRGLPLVVQARKRAFPMTERAEDVCRVLEEYMRAGAVEVRTQSPVQHVAFADGRITSVTAGGEEVVASQYILATGGVSHPETGSTGDGFSWLCSMGHVVSEPAPTVVPLAVDDAWVRRIAGTTLPRARIAFYLDGKRMCTASGDILCAHFGLTGPTILNVAGRVSDLLRAGVVTARIDVHPTLDLGALDAQITKVFDANKNKSVRNVLNDIGPLGFGPALLLLMSDVPPDTKVHSVTREQRKRIGNLLKALPVAIEGLMGLDRAIVSDGGIAVTDVDMRTMRSRIISNLFVTGDILNIRRPSGGFSLQLCWTTGFVAGTAASE